MSGWECVEKEDGVVGYYLEQPPLSFAIWGVVPHASDDTQRWGWAFHLTSKREQVTIASEKPFMGSDIKDLAAPRTEAYERLHAAFEAWRTLVNQPLSQLDDAEEMPPVVRHISVDQTVGREELRRATFARPVKMPGKP